MAVKDEVSKITETLSHIGKLMPDVYERCPLMFSDMIDEIDRLTTLENAVAFYPDPRVNELRKSDIRTIRRVIQLSNIPLDSREELESTLTRAEKFIDDEQYTLATDELHRAGRIIRDELPEWLIDCACVDKRQMLSGIHYGVDVHKEIDPTHKNIIWQDTIATLNRRGILTADEADRLIKEVRW